MIEDCELPADWAVKGVLKPMPAHIKHTAKINFLMIFNI